MECDFDEQILRMVDVAMFNKLCVFNLTEQSNNEKSRKVKNDHEWNQLIHQNKTCSNSAAIAKSYGLTSKKNPKNHHHCCSRQ